MRHGLASPAWPVSMMKDLLGEAADLVGEEKALFDLGAKDLLLLCRRVERALAGEEGRVSGSGESKEDIVGVVDVGVDARGAGGAAWRDTCNERRVSRWMGGTIQSFTVTFVVVSLVIYTRSSRKSIHADFHVSPFASRARVDSVTMATISNPIYLEAYSSLTGVSTNDYYFQYSNMAR